MNLSSRQRVLFPTDFQPHSQEAFPHAERLAAARNAEILVLHVCNMPDVSWSIRPSESLHTMLRRQLADIESDRVPLNRHFTVADPGPEICRVAEEFLCHTIVMGIEYKSGADRFPCGDVHSFVAKYANCPLVTVHSTAPTAVRPEQISATRFGRQDASHRPRIRQSEKYHSVPSR